MSCPGNNEDDTSSVDANLAFLSSVVKSEQKPEVRPSVSASSGPGRPAGHPGLPAVVGSPASCPTSGARTHVGVAAQPRSWNSGRQQGTAGVMSGIGVTSFAPTLVTTASRRAPLVLSRPTQTVTASRSPPPRSISPTVSSSMLASMGFVGVPPVSKSIPSMPGVAVVAAQQQQQSPAAFDMAQLSRRGSALVLEYTQKEDGPVNQRALLQKMRDVALRAGLGVSVSESAAGTLSLGIQTRVKGVFESLAKACLQRCETRVEALSGLPVGVDSATLAAAVDAQRAWEITSDLKTKLAEMKQAQLDLKARREGSKPSQQVAAGDIVMSLSGQQQQEAAAVGRNRNQAANAAAMMALGGPAKPPNAPKQPVSAAAPSPSSSPAVPLVASTSRPSQRPTGSAGSGPPAPERRITARDLTACHRIVGIHVLQKIAIRRNRRAARLSQQ